MRVYTRHVPSSPGPSATSAPVQRPIRAILAKGTILNCRPDSNFFSAARLYSKFADLRRFLRFPGSRP